MEKRNERKREMSLTPLAELDAEAVDDIRQALQLGMPVGSERFAEVICERLGIRHNSGKRGRPIGPAGEANTQAMAEQQDFGF